MGGTRGELCGCCGSEACSWQNCLWCCCRRGPRAEKNPAATEICRLRWNWFYLILLASLDVINYSSPLPSFHQFVTNPTPQQLNGTGRELQIEAGLGLSEKFYHIAVSSFSIGEFLGALMGGFLASRIPFWYSAMGALLCHIVGFVIYATAVSGWMLIGARILSGTFVGLQSVISFTYFGVSYQHYLEVIGPKERKKEAAKTTRVKDQLFAFYAVAANVGTLFGPGFAAIIAQFHINHFRSVAWYNVVIGIGYIFLQLAMFRGESKCDCQNTCRKSNCSLPKKSKFKEMMTWSNVFLIMIVGFLILARGSITSKFIVYEMLFNPILSDSFGFTVKQTSYFFVLLLPAHVGGAFMVLLMQRLKLNSRIITILGVFFSMIGLILMADWQSIPPDRCTDFSLYHHPEIANNLSHSLRPCLTSPSGCQWPTNDGTVQNVSTEEDNMAVIESILEYVEIPDSFVHVQGPGSVSNVTVYNVAMNVCESLRESKHHCHWIPRSIVTGTFCADCPSICRGTDHILNFIQFTIGAFIFRITIPISRIAIMIVISDVISKDYQSIVMGLAYASTGVFRSVTPLLVGAAYEGVQKRTFLAMSIMIATQIPLMLILGLLYHKLGQLRKQQMQVGASEPLPSKSPSSNQDGVSDDEDATEMSELLSPEKTPLKESSN